MDFNIDIDSIAREVNEAHKIEYRDPHADPYVKYTDDGRPRTTKAQARVMEVVRKLNLMRVGVVGAKGSAKSHGGAEWAYHWGQKHAKQMHSPLKGCIVANTDRQAKDAAGDVFVRVTNILGYSAEYFSSKKIGGQQYSKFYAVDLDGQGYDEGKGFLLMVRAFESVQAMEGSEFDFMWVEELQDANRDKFVVALSRNRGNGVTDGIREIDEFPDALILDHERAETHEKSDKWRRDRKSYAVPVWRGNVEGYKHFVLHPERGPIKEEPNPLYIAGMTESELHWMYDMMENQLGMDTDGSFDPVSSRGLLLEPTLFENSKNIGQSTIDSYLESMDPETAQRHVYGKRTAASSNLVLHQYRDDLHRTGRMSELLATYDPYSEIILSIDFNVSPMCATTWQKKMWSDEWDRDELLYEYGDDGTVEKIKEYAEPTIDGSGQVVAEYSSPQEIATPDREVLAQVDEFEVWNGGTRGLMEEFVERYAQHAVDVTVVGDATGNKDDTRGGITDWDIIRDVTADMKNVFVLPGLEQSTDIKQGRTKYSNPPRRDTINVTNAVLRNAKGEVRMCFLPKSELESGGAAASCAMIKRKPDGKVDDRPDREEGKEVRRTHFFDTVRYAVWYWTDGYAPSEEEIESVMSDLEAMRHEKNKAKRRDPDDVLFGQDERSEWFF